MLFVKGGLLLKAQVRIGCQIEANFYHVQCAIKSNEKSMDKYPANLCQTVLWWIKFIAFGAVEFRHFEHYLG